MSIKIDPIFSLSKKTYVAFSGGPDSTALLDIINKLSIQHKFPLIAFHINHKISKNSKEWEKHCKKFCEERNIKFQSKEVTIKQLNDGLESAARKARYKIFNKIVKKDEQLLMGHHSDDVAETILLRLFRGTGPDGLEGPPKKRKIGEGVLLRPFLALTKKAIYEYLELNNINYIQDETNFESNQDRNYIRNNILPLVNERWIDSQKRIAQTSRLIREKREIFDYMFYKDFNNLISSKISVKKLKMLNNEVVKEILRASIKNEGIALPSLKVMNEIIKTFIKSSPGKKSVVRWSRADKDQEAGMIEFSEGHIIIRKITTI